MRLIGYYDGNERSGKYHIDIETEAGMPIASMDLIDAGNKTARRVTMQMLRDCAASLGARFSYDLIQRDDNVDRLEHTRVGKVLANYEIFTRMNGVFRCYLLFQGQSDLISGAEEVCLVNATNDQAENYANTMARRVCEGSAMEWLTVNETRKSFPYLVRMRPRYLILGEESTLSYKIVDMKAKT